MFNEKEQNVLKHFFTNSNDDVFALINLPEVVKGTLFARYSRSDKNLRQLFLDDFFNSKENDFNSIVGDIKNVDEQLLAIKKAEDFYNRVLAQYGDDSVAELGGAHIAFENVSILATKFLEDARIGLSPLEKSTRYVYFNEKENGKYKYYLDSDIMESKFEKEYVEKMDLLFDTYVDLMKPLRDYYATKIPNTENLSERAFEAVLRAKTCDTIRGLLPASTKTNMGVFGNGRAFEYLINKLLVSDLKELNTLGEKTYAELSKVFPSFVKRSKNEFGLELQNYFKSVKIPKNYEAISQNNVPVKLINYDADAEERILSKIIYFGSNLSMEDCLKNVKLLSLEERKKIILEYVGMRTNRRHKPLRAFENTDYTFDLLVNFGAYRDLERHRILTQERQLLTTHYGYYVPKEIIDLGLDKKYKFALDEADKLYNKMTDFSREKAQYCVPLAYKLRWYFKFNLREAYHLLELRTIRQGHPDYRILCQQMFKEIQNVHPLLVEPMKYVDLNLYDFERLESEKQIDKRLDDLKK